MVIFTTAQERELLERLRTLGQTDKTSHLAAEVLRLKEEISTLTIEKSKITEQNAREKRELTHMIGLEKTRQSVELEQAKREATLVVREENLAAERAQFEKTLAFNTERFQSMERYMKDMTEQILGRLPTVTVDRVTKSARR